MAFVKIIPVFTRLYNLKRDEFKGVLRKVYVAIDKGEFS